MFVADGEDAPYRVAAFWEAQTTWGLAERSCMALVAMRLVSLCVVDRGKGLSSEITLYTPVLREQQHTARRTVGHLTCLQSRHRFAVNGRKEVLSGRGTDADVDLLCGRE